MKTIYFTGAIAAGLVGVLPAAGLAQGSEADIPDIEVPSVILDVISEQVGPAAADDEADLANIVLAAAKGITTVQEAPAIVTIVTDDDIAKRRLQGLDQIIDKAPGFYRVTPINGSFSAPMVRGQIQAVQLLQDSLSLFDPTINTPALVRVLPTEIIKRVEMITGPGGVLWGSNSLMGIVNVITKDAEDVDGVEVGATVGHGEGDRRMFHSYAMAGVPDLLGGKVKLFAHGSFETFQGVRHEMPMVVANAATPAPTAPAVFGPLIGSEQPQSYLFNLNGKLTIGKLQVRVSYPWGERQNPATLGGNPTRESLPNDATCQRGETDLMRCLDPERLGRQNQLNYFDRFVVGEYRTRLAKDRAGISAKAYGVQFERSFEPLLLLPPSDFVAGTSGERRAFPGGNAIRVKNIAYRLGGALDGDVEFSTKARVLYGAEVFSEWSVDNTTDSRQGTGVEARFPTPYGFRSPYDPSTIPLPLPCPRRFDPATMRSEVLPECPQTFTFSASRTVAAAYVNPRYRPVKTVILDAGARVQVAPDALGKVSYPATTTFAGTLVWNFLPAWHLKMNFAQGFRPPVFNNTAANGLSAQVAGNPNLKVETSNAAQAEINARVFKGDREIRELSFRVDGSYTKLNNLIQVSSGSYENSGEREIFSGEFLGKLYVQGGHRLELGYTYLRGSSADRGALRSLPEHWFNFSTVFNVMDDKLIATTNLRVAGAAEDPNRIVEYRNLALDERGGIAVPVAVLSSEGVLDRIPPSADLSLGLSWTPAARLSISGTVYNALSAHYYQPDVFSDYEPRLEYLPNPYEKLRAYLSATYQY